MGTVILTAWLFYQYDLSNLQQSNAQTNLKWVSCVKTAVKNALIHRNLHCPLCSHPLHKCHRACSKSRHSTTQGDMGCPLVLDTAICVYVSVCYWVCIYQATCAKGKRDSCGAHVHHVAQTESEWVWDAPHPPATPPTPQNLLWVQGICGRHVTLPGYCFN